MRRIGWGIAALAFAQVSFADGAPLAAPTVTGGGLQLSTQQTDAGYVLTVTGGRGVAIRREFAQGGSIGFSDRLPDGQYSWELQRAPQQTRRRTEQEATAPVNEVVPATDAREKEAGSVQWGHFQIANGTYVVPSNTPE